MKKKFTLAIISILSCISLHAQYSSPVKIPIYLSGNFGELRNNHFHSGIDIKTQSVINKPVYSVADGYVSRISVSPSGYGLALYITHPSTGQVSVYGHLNSFAPKFQAYIKDKQYEQESFRVNLILNTKEFPVKKGDLVAYSGNSGSSGGPHLHFELRDEKTENILDPLVYFKSEIADNAAPELRGIAIYPTDGKGVINGSKAAVKQNVSKSKKGQYLDLKQPIEAWGEIGFAVKGFDRMTGTPNIYGVKQIKLYMDQTLIFFSKIESLGFDQSRMINSFIDFDDWRRNKSFFMKSFVEPGNRLPFFSALNKGYVNINKEQVYDFTYELEDVYGNKTSYSFSVTGKKQAIPAQTKDGQLMQWYNDNKYSNDKFSLEIPKNNLYDDFMFVLKQSKSSKYPSDLFSVNNTYIPLHSGGEIKIKLNTDTLKRKSQYGIVSVKNNGEQWVGGSYKNGYVTAIIRELGANYTVSSDTQAPVITPIKAELWAKSEEIKIKATDTKSGISTFRGTIDNKFALFENDTKSSVFSYTFDPERLTKDQQHTLSVIVTDACGNSTEYVTNFYW